MCVYRKQEASMCNSCALAKGWYIRVPDKNMRAMHALKACQKRVEREAHVLRP